MAREINQDEAGTSIEDLEVIDSSEVRGGQAFGLGELQETTVSNSPTAGSSNANNRGHLLVGVDDVVLR